MKIVCWNMAHRLKPWRSLLDMPGVDVGLLQEAAQIPEDLRERVSVDKGLWDSAPGPRSGFPSVVARLSDDVKVCPIEILAIADAGRHDFYASEWGTLAAATVKPAGGGESITVISMAAGYNRFTHESGSPSRSETIGSVHRLISDLSRLVGKRSRVIAAGDWTINQGWSSQSNPVWNRREALHFRTAFDRMSALGFCHLMPEGCKNDRAGTISYMPIRATPAQAWAQLDFVFATVNIADRLSVRALNRPDHWGPSDHCRIVIDID